MCTCSPAFPGTGRRMRIMCLAFRADRVADSARLGFHRVEPVSLPSNWSTGWPCSGLRSLTLESSGRFTRFMSRNVHTPDRLRARGRRVSLRRG